MSAHCWCQAGLYIHVARAPVTMPIARLRGVLQDARGAADLGGCNVPGDHQLERADQVNLARLDRPIRPILAADQAVLENAGGGTSRSSGSMDSHKRCPPQRQRWYCSSVTEHERWPMHGGAVRYARYLES
jgi:hypothetical protein